MSRDGKYRGRNRDACVCAHDTVHIVPMRSPERSSTSLPYSPLEISTRDTQGIACVPTLTMSVFAGSRVTIGVACGSPLQDIFTMTIPTRARAVASAIVLSLAFVACGPKDADIKTSVDTAIAGVKGVTVNVVDGVATISGQFADDAAKASTETLVKGVNGVKSVVDNATITPPPPPVVISPDEMLKTSVTAALKDVSTLMADVKDGVVTLTGEVKKSELPRVMQALSALNPKKIENKATVKK